LRQSLESADRLLVTKNAAIAKLESELSTARQKIFEADAEIEDLESELARRSPTQSETSPLTKADLSDIDAADLTNKLKTRRKKSKADLADLKIDISKIETFSGKIVSS